MLSKMCIWGENSTLFKKYDGLKVVKVQNDKFRMFWSFTGLLIMDFVIRLEHWQSSWRGIRPL
jgi:hypothetical protein